MLSETNPAAARAALQQATVIWFCGGSQTRLINRLNTMGLTDLVRERHAQGLVAGGTSAGAAVMSRVMIAGNGAKPEDPPKIIEGLGLWPEVIVDQHFAQRKREPRLRRAVKLHPELPGVGIDEGTAVMVRGAKFEVIGSGEVKVIDARRRKDEPETTVLSVGQKYSLEAAGERDH